ncbi:MAG TPA: MFS transporter, partial [Chloroflexia bacterium]
LPARISLAAAFRLDLRAHRTFAWLVASRFLFLLGTYAVGRFFLYFIADRLGLDPAQAAGEAGGLLAGLTLVTVLAALPAGWAADRWGRLPLMLAGAAVSALGTLGLIVAGGAGQILLFGGLMAVGSAAFAGANWALTADVAPPAEAARFFGLANVGTAGAAAAAGLFGPLIDSANAAAPGLGYTVLFAGATLAFVLSGAVLGFARPAARPSVIFGE